MAGIGRRKSGERKEGENSDLHPVPSNFTTGVCAHWRAVTSMALGADDGDGDEASAAWLVDRSSTNNNTCCGDRCWCGVEYCWRSSARRWRTKIATGAAPPPLRSAPRTEIGCRRPGDRQRAPPPSAAAAAAANCRAAAPAPSLSASDSTFSWTPCRARQQQVGVAASSHYNYYTEITAAFRLRQHVVSVRALNKRRSIIKYAFS